MNGRVCITFPTLVACPDAKGNRGWTAQDVGGAGDNKRPDRHALAVCTAK